MPGVNEELPCTLNSELQNFFERNSEKFDVTRIEVFTSENDEKPKVRVSKVKRYTDNQGISHLKIR
ncbi:hypothetical protein CI088_15750 [Enterococcus plantarum]|uniref:Uncharacterized protein n=1 Tax=Enterococcus plantarum TaxID=1077675 RepID=A0A2W3ZMS0_9ENTE|nr:hypothetical protein CI088_15750 [Enterococcus plantarum]